MGFTQFLEVFIPLFVAIDPIGMVPVFLALTAGMSPNHRRRVSLEAVLVATIVALGFMFLGQSLFRFLGITADDFRIAGGVILLVLAVLDLLVHGKPTVDAKRGVGLVPIAMPLIAGPALLTTLLVLTTSANVPHPYILTAVGLAVNMVLLLLFLLGATWIGRLLGEQAMEAASKLVMILLAAIAVNFIRMGIQNVLAASQGG